ncbi:hypothetical protein BDN72DRAFT_864566 [Pluteus cervinus]|uniref:Uncharacterized protein n=1 Tax=Pluteus cervinus TaxID=181527 RepID=A0ACD3A3F7_9AGAR|nr:hypothetical protein BDN72DRAFT_864566 [Pluteus cervinus]
MQLISLYDKFSPAIRDVRNNPCPVSTLPIELLQEIFAFSMTMKPSLRIRSSVPMDERKPPVFQATALILTWVCSQWRHIALSMPELWGTMSIYTPKSYCVQLVKLYLSRSGEDTPLDLHLRQGDSVDNSVYHYPEKVPEHKVTADILKLWVPQAHRWRSISLAMTYTAPVHELPKITPGALSRSYCVQLVKLYLSRSGEDTPLDLHLRQGDSVDNSVYHYPEKVPEHKVTADILKLWVPQAHRWRSISLAMTYTAPVHELPKITPGALSRVQEASLQFKFSWGSNDRVIQWLWANIFQSPALRIAYWHDLSKLPTAPFSQLSEFGPFHPKTDEFLTSLPSFQGLRRLTVGVISKRVSHQMTLLDSPVILPYLEYLNLCIGQEAPGVLDEISAPVLRELKIVDRRDAAFAEVHSLEQFLARSECTLRSLRLTQRRVKTETPIIENLLLDCQRHLVF